MGEVADTTQTQSPTSTERQPTPASPRRFRKLLILGVGCCLLLALLALFLDRGYSEGGPRVGVVDIRGAIVGARKALEALRDFRLDPAVVAVVLRVDSPGGAVAASQEIYREIGKLRAVKPVVASLGNIAASGGYYVASAASKVLASAGTITGSIGVITHSTDVSDLLRVARVKTETIKTGKFKDTLSPLRSITPEERAYIQGLVNAVLNQFVDDVAAGRKLSKERVERIADGRVFSGAQAVTFGLVDKLGNFGDAVTLAARLARAEGEPWPVYPKARGGWLERIIRRSMDTVVATIGDALRSGLASRRLEVQVRTARF